MFLQQHRFIQFIIMTLKTLSHLELEFSHISQTLTLKALIAMTHELMSTACHGNLKNSHLVGKCEQSFHVE